MAFSSVKTFRSWYSAFLPGLKALTGRWYPMTLTYTSVT